MLPALSLLVLAASSSPLSRAREAVASGDLVRWQTLRGSGAAPSADWAQLDDLAALMRCRPLPPRPFPLRGTAEANRRLLELVEARLRRHLLDGAHPASGLPRLVRAASSLTVAKPAPVGTVRWPRDEEKWPEERAVLRVRSAACGGASRPEGVRARRWMEQLALTKLVETVDAIPAGLRSAVLSSYLHEAELAGPSFRIPKDVMLGIRRGILSSPPGGHRDLAEILIARRLLDVDPSSVGDISRLRRVANSAVGSTAWAARVAWVRARMAVPEDVLTATEVPMADAPPEARAWLDHQRLRALLVLGSEEEIARFGRAFARRRRPNRIDDATFELLLDAQLVRSPALAMSAAMTFGDPEPRAVRARWWRLAAGALDARQWPFAKAVLDRLWLEAHLRQPPPADLADIVGARAEVALAQGNERDFRSLMAELLTLRRSGRRRRALARVAQRSLALLPSAALGPRRRFARIVLDAVRDQRRSGRRLARDLHEAEPVWAEWAGEASSGEVRPSRRRRRPPPRPLGEVEVVRRPLPVFAPPRIQLVVPPVFSYLVWFDVEGRRQVGLPPYAREGS